MDTWPIYPISLISGLPNPIYLYIRPANRTQPELTWSLEADLIAKPNSDKAHRSLGLTKEPGGTTDRTTPHDDQQTGMDSNRLVLLGTARDDT